MEPSNSNQVSSHSIQLTGLSAGTTYYYRGYFKTGDIGEVIYCGNSHSKSPSLGSGWKLKAFCNELRN